MNINSLQLFLNQNTIPKIKKRPKTFLSIAKQPHYENVISNIYSFYFNIEEVHGMGDLFINSLLEIIDESKLGTIKKVSEIIDFEVNTEVCTKKNGRIDLLLSSHDHAIIIENKVYHRLNNNLSDYWDSIGVTDNIQENKIGIVLSLNKLSVNHDHFINITHLEFLKRVIQNLGYYFMSAKDKYVIFLKDFYQNSINLSKSEMNSNELKFYFDNQTKIIEAKDFHFAVRTHIVNQIEQVNKLVDEDLILQTSKGEGSKRLRYFLSTKNKDLMITIVFLDLLTTEKRLFLIVELKNSLLKDKSGYRSIIFTNEERNILNPQFYDDKNSLWSHFASVSYTLDDNEISKLGEYIADKLEKEGLLSIYRKINTIISKS